MNDILVRIRDIFKKSGKSQTEIGEIINKTPQYIWRILNVDDINPSKGVIEDIYTKMTIDGEPINKDWLLTGKGRPTIKRTRSQEIGNFASEVMNLPDENIKKRLIDALVKLNERDWETIAKIAESLKEGG